MKTRTKLLGLLAVVPAAVLLAAGALRAIGIVNPFVNETALAYNKTYSIDLNKAALNTISAQANYSSATITAQTFSSGQVSTGSLKIVDNTSLSTASATNAITVLSTAGALGDSLVVTKRFKPGAFVFTAGRDWNYMNTTTGTAASILTALNTVPEFSTIRAGAVLYSTANTFGSSSNSIIIQTNNPATLAISSPTFLGGQDATTVFVNGYSFRAGVQFAVGATAAATATNLANAVNARKILSRFVSAATATSSVTFQSLGVGTLYNFPLATSNSAAISVSAANLVGGANAAWALGSKNLTIPAHGFTLALPLLYGTGGSPAIAGLANQTTYYAIPVDANTLQLASSQGNALAGTAITLASSSTLTSAVSYSLAPLPIAGVPSFKWQVSNDNTNWTDLAVASVTMTSYFTPPASTAWDLGRLNLRYLRLNVVGPTAGGIFLQVTVNGSTTF